MKRRQKPDPAAWRNSPAGDEKYRAARAEAQKRANELGYDYGIEANDLFRSFHVFMLPSAQHRCGHELSCEVVHPERLENCKPGHGPAPTREEIRKVYNQ